MADPGDFIPNAIRNWIEELIADGGGGGATDLSAYEGESISLTTTDGDANILVDEGDYLNIASPESFADSGNGVAWGGGTAGAGSEKFRVTFGAGGVHSFTLWGTTGTAEIQAADISLIADTLTFNGAPLGVSPFGDDAVQVEGDFGGVAWEGPDNTAILAFRQTGDAHDRVQIWADGSFLLGSGVDEPVFAFSVGIDGLIAYGLDGRFEAGTGPIVMSPNGNPHRLIVANDGSVSSEPVV